MPEATKPGATVEPGSATKKLIIILSMSPLDDDQVVCSKRSYAHNNPIHIANSSIKGKRKLLLLHDFDGGEKSYWFNPPSGHLVKCTIISNKTALPQSHSCSDCMDLFQVSRILYTEFQDTFETLWLLVKTCLSSYLHSSPFSWMCYQTRANGSSLPFFLELEQIHPMLPQNFDSLLHQEIKILQIFVTTNYHKCPHYDNGLLHSSNV